MKISKDQVFGMLNEFADAYELHYKTKYRMNRVKMQWDMQRLLEDFGAATVRQVIRFYFAVDRPRHDLYNFYSQFDKLLSSMERQTADDEARQRRREETERLKKERRLWLTGKN